MKILFIGVGTADENSGLSGGDVRFFEIAKAWQAKGHEIHLLGSRGSQKLCSKLGLNVVLHNFSVIDGGGRATAILLAFKTLFFSPILGSFMPDIVYSNNDIVFDIFPALKLKIKYGKKIKWVSIVHWLPPLPWKRKQSKLRHSTLFFISERISIWLANFFADVLLPVSKSTEKRMREVGINMNKVSAVECGVNYSEIRSLTISIKEKKYEAVFMKRLQAVKGLFDLIDIWERVARSVPSARLIVIGSGIKEEVERAKKIIREKRLEKNIEFLGAIQDPKLKFTKLAESKIFILPTYEENWAIVVGEAMAAGIPVLAYDLKELEEVWEDNFIKIPLGNKDYFAQKILEIINSPEELDRISRKALDFVKKYDWSLVTKKEMDIILK